MAFYTSPLDNVTVASPCPAEWESMFGDERVRFCGQCQLNVYNLSGMARREAERLVANAEGRVCVRFYRRKDGTILTKNCPVGLRAFKRRVSRLARATISAALGFLSGFGFNLAVSRGGDTILERTMGVMVSREPVKTGPPTSVNAGNPPDGLDLVQGDIGVGPGWTRGRLAPVKEIEGRAEMPK